MTSWESFCADVKKAFTKASVKVGEFADGAADSIKAETFKLKLCERYEELGKIVYSELKSGNGSPATAEKAAEKINEIDSIMEMIEALKGKNTKKSESAE